MSATRRAPRRKSFRSGPWKGVRNTNDPADDAPDILADAVNCFIPDAIGGSGTYQRPGLSLMFGGVTVNTGTFRGQGAFSHTALDGTVYNFIVEKGKLYRTDATLQTRTDVTPVGVTIDASVTTRVYGTSFANQLVITDGVNRPWLATNLSGTPITGTYIDYNGAGTTWAAFGPAVAWGGSIFFIVSQTNNVYARTDILWSIAGDASQGYQQTNYDNRWTLLQTATDPLWALAATNVALNYFRARSIGSISGAVGPTLASSATHDSISVNIGTEAPQCIVLYGTTIFFVDVIGRPYRLAQGGEPEPIWLQMRALVDSSNSGFPGITKLVATAAFEPTLNLYVVAIWSCLPSQNGPPVEIQAFDAVTGRYFGRWKIGSGFQIDCMGNFIDPNGRGVLVALGSNAAPTSSTLASSGYAWYMNGLGSAAGDFLTDETPAPGAVNITTEDGTLITTEGLGAATWQDNGATPEISATTPRLGYDIDTVLNVDRMGALVGTSAPCAVSAKTASLAQTVEATPTPSTVQDGIAEIMAGFDGVQGRGATIIVAPQSATSQWSLHQVSIDAVVMPASVEDP